MKRYALEENETRFAGEVNIDHIMIEDGDGDYVLYSEAQAEIDRLKSIILCVVNDLPSNRDWLDPDLEKEMREVKG